MSDLDQKLALVIFGSCILTLIIGIKGVLLKNKTSNKSNYYISINLLIWGIMMIPLGVAFYICRIKTLGHISDNLAYMWGSLWFGITGLICGSHALFYKKIIKNSAYDSLSKSAIFIFIVVVITITINTLIRGWPK